MPLSLIAALSPNRAIGYRGRLPWHIPEDLRHFKEITTGHTVIMGRTTFTSLPNGALPQRRNIVVSHNMAQTEGCEVARSLDEALALCDADERVFVIGGASIYRQALPLASRLYLTLVDKDPKGADAFFPPLDMAQWRITKKEKHTGFSFMELERR